MTKAKSKATKSVVTGHEAAEAIVAKALAVPAKRVRKSRAKPPSEVQALAALVGDAQVCPLCLVQACVPLTPAQLAEQKDGTTHVCHPKLGGCNHGFGPAAKPQPPVGAKKKAAHTLSLISNHRERSRVIAIVEAARLRFAERGISGVLVANITDPVLEALRLIRVDQIKTVSISSAKELTDLESDNLYNTHFQTKESQMKKSDTDQAKHGEKVLARGGKRAEGRKEPAQVETPVPATKKSKAQVRAIEKKARVEAKRLAKAGKSVVPGKHKKAKGEKKPAKAKGEKKESNIDLMARLLIAGTSKTAIHEAFSTRYSAKADEGKHAGDFIQKRIDIYSKIAMRLPEVKEAVEAQPSSGKKAKSAKKKAGKASAKKSRASKKAADEEE